LSPGHVSVTESKAAEKDGFLQSVYTLKYLEYDPRVGDLVEVSPLDDEYSMYLWCSQWVQERAREDKEADVITDDIDWSKILPPPEPGVVY